MIAVLLLWAAVLPPVLATGAWLLARCDSAHTIGRAADRLILAVWLGLISVSLVLLPIAWWRPLTPAVYAGSSALLLLLGHRELKAILAAVWARMADRRRWPVLAVPLIVAIAVAIYATRPVTIYDTGLYHYPLIHWLGDVGLPRGLALIHSRFGFPSAWFTIPAALDHGPVRGRVAGLMGSLALLMLVTHWLLVLHRCVQGRALAADRFAVWGLAVLLCFVADKAWLISASPDAPLAALPLVLAWLWLLAGRSPAALAVGFLLALGAVCLKLSALPMFAVALIAAVASPALRQHRGMPVGLLAGAVLALGLVVISSLIGSGCVYYPIGASCLHWPWSVAAATAADETQRVVDWARWAGNTPDPNGSWIGVWARAHDLELALGTLSVLVLAWRIRRWRSVAGAGLALTMAIGGIAFGMVAAPDPRFWAGHLFTLVGLALWSCTRTDRPDARSQSGDAAHTLRPPTLLIVSALLLVMAVAGREHKRATSEGAAAASFWLLPATLPTPWRDRAAQERALVAAQSASGLRYLHPRAGDQCWDAPLPCAPHPLEFELRYRDPRRGAEGGFERAR